MVSNVNEEWVSDQGVQRYFQETYLSGRFTYPLRANTTLTGLPSAVADIHGGVHYAQAAHNENGLTRKVYVSDYTKYIRESFCILEEYGRPDS